MDLMFYFLQHKLEVKKLLRKKWKGCFRIIWLMRDLVKLVVGMLATWWPSEEGHILWSAFKRPSETKRDQMVIVLEAYLKYKNLDPEHYYAGYHQGGEEYEYEEDESINKSISEEEFVDLK